MQQFIHLVCEMAPYLLIGFLLAGLMHAFIPGRFYGRYLAASNFRSVVNAALLGIPLPLCSCGVIPTAMSLRREGASRGAVVSFLIATPQTGIDSILATYGLMGLPFAIVRPLAALATSLLGGGLALIGHADDTRPQTRTCDSEAARQHFSFAKRLKEALRYGFVDMMQDIGRWLALGLVVAAIITIGIPQSWFTLFEGNTWASMLLVLLIAIPMYVCATGSIPIAVALMLKGLTPGAALVLLMAGPACNLASMLVVRKVLGTRTLILYLASIVIGAVLFGSAVDYLQFHHQVDFLSQLTARDACCMMAGNSWWATLSGIVLLLLLLNALVVVPYRQRHSDLEAHACGSAPSAQTAEPDSVVTNNNQQSHHHPTTMKKSYHIEGMNCNHCRLSAEKAILSVPGVTSATVDLQSKEAIVEGTASPEAICKAVGEVGFTCSC